MLAYVLLSPLAVGTDDGPTMGMVAITRDQIAWVSRCYLADVGGSMRDPEYTRTSNISSSKQEDPR